MARSPAGLNQLLEWGWADFSPPAPPPGVRSGSVRLDALGDGFEELGSILGELGSILGSG